MGVGEDLGAGAFENQAAEDFLVLNADDAATAGLAQNDVKSQVRWFSRTKTSAEGAWVRAGNIVWREQGSERYMREGVWAAWWARPAPSLCLLPFFHFSFFFSLFYCI